MSEARGAIWQMTVSSSFCSIHHHSSDDIVKNRSLHQIEHEHCVKNRQRIILERKAGNSSDKSTTDGGRHRSLQF